MIRERRSAPPAPAPAAEATPQQWSMLSPQPLADATAFADTGGGGNSMVREWIARQHEGPYEREYGGDDLGADFQVPRGQLTFDAEGTEGGPFHTRSAHLPPVGASGVTIGRGYDLGQHTADQITTAMTGAGVSEEDAGRFAGAAGLRRRGARRWLDRNEDALPEITPGQQHALFGTTYEEMSADVDRISNSPSATRAYGALDLDRADPAVRDLLVDLRYRGDYTPASRRMVQRPAVEGDVTELRDVLCDRSRWRDVPEDRFERRCAYANEAVEERDLQASLPRTFLAPIEHMGDPNYDLNGNRIRS